MSMKVAHNIAAINTNKNLYSSNRMMNKSLEKLSSGYRINVGQDGPADLVISEQLRAQQAGLERAVRNTTEAINVISIAEGALNEMNSILKKMKALAIHAANNGITSPEQIAADQAEMDSGIQTLERIANVTKYSDQFMLNGSKDITYNSTVSVKGTQNNKLVNDGLTNFQQIFKRDGYQVSISFNGKVPGGYEVAAIGNAAMTTQAAKAYLEVDCYDESISQVNSKGELTQGQSFILTGQLGSRQFNFSSGAHISEVVTAIKNVAGSTGIDASLTFNRNQAINKASAVPATQANVSVVTADQTSVIMYDNYRTNDDGTMSLIATDVAVTDYDNIIFGKNTDGHGNIYVKITGDGTTYELYKDASLSTESKIGSGATAVDATGLNNSGITDVGLQITLGADAKYGDVFKINFGNVMLDNAADGSGNVVTTGAGATSFNMAASTASGVQLGTNTDSSGKLHFKVVSDGASYEIYAYKDALMRPEDLVAKSMQKVAFAAGDSVILDAIWNDEHTASTGLGLTLQMDGAAALARGTYEFDLQFTNLGMRVFSSEYGSDAFIQVQQFGGGLFVNYEDAGNYETAKLIDAGGTGVTFRKTGQDATVNVNGQQMKTTGLTLNLATPDVMADLTFNAGKTGSTTVAQVGYGEGSIFTKNTSLNFINGLDNAGIIQSAMTGANAHYSALLNNACHNTQEKIGNFQGGMQLQLGEGSGDQERTVVGIKSMSTAQLGRIEVTKAFSSDSAVIETKTLSIQNVMGGQLASLSQDPNTAMKIIEKAISDVSELRAQLGAVQANMLQTNENNLRVAIENIAKTESDIRDTDMASEMTEFTKNQVLSNAGVSMLTQANAQAQNVLQLLR